MAIVGLKYKFHKTCPTYVTITYINRDKSKHNTKNGASILCKKLKGKCIPASTVLDTTTKVTSAITKTSTSKTLQEARMEN